jgi:hypothetical protein
MNKSFAIVLITVTLFIGFMLGFSIPPYIHAGVFSEREEKGVAIEVDENIEQFYEDLYKDAEEEDE